MSKAQIWEEIPKLSHSERRELMKLLVSIEQDQHVLEECDQMAAERFRMLDALEAEDEKNNSR